MRLNLLLAVFALLAVTDQAAVGQTPATAGAAAAAASVTLAADEWCPYNCAVGSDRPGYMVEIARRAFARRGVTVNYVVMPWSRALADAEAGKVDGVIGASKTDFRSGVFPRIPQGRNEAVLVLNADNPFTWSGLPSLRGLRLAAVQGYSYDQGPIDAWLASPEAKKLVEFGWGEEVQSQNIRKLLTRRVDAWIENRNVALMTIADISPLPALKMVSVGAAESVYVAFSRSKSNAATYAELLAAETAALRKSGELAQILAKYNLRDWE